MKEWTRFFVCDRSCLSFLLYRPQTPTSVSTPVVSHVRVIAPSRSPWPCLSKQRIPSLRICRTHSGRRWYVILSCLSLNCPLQAPRPALRKLFNSLPRTEPYLSVDCQGFIRYPNSTGDLLTPLGAILFDGTSMSAHASDAMANFFVVAGISGSIDGNGRMLASSSTASGSGTKFKVEQCPDVSVYSHLRCVEPMYRRMLRLSFICSLTRVLRSATGKGLCLTL